MEKILGLDLGTTSIGWALMEKGKRLIDGGVIIFPRGNNLDGVSGKEASFSQQRTTYRSMRRLQQRRKLRRDRLLRYFHDWWGLTTEAIHGDTSPDELYRIRALSVDPANHITLLELCRIFLFFAKKRGFKSNRKTAAKDGDETGVVKQGIAELHRQLEETGARTLGEYLYQLILAHRRGERLNERILQRWTDRKMYLEEFDSILLAQAANHPEITPEQSNILRREIFFQRPLKSAKHLVATCRYEPQKKVMPKSHPVFQDFRLWQNLNNLTWINRDTGEFGNLSLEQLQEAERLYKFKLKVTDAQLKTTLGLSKRAELNEISLKPCSTEIGMRNAIGDKEWSQLSNEDHLNLYHALLYSDDDHFEEFVASLHRKWGLSRSQAEGLWELTLEPDYGSISHKAANKILQYLKQGYPYEEAAVKAGYHHSVRNTFQNLDRIPLLQTNELRNPVVQKAVGQCINLVNKVIDIYGKPDEVVIELARDLKKPKEDREKEWRRNKVTEKRREDYARVLSQYIGKSVPTWDSLITKYELWLELGCEGDDFSGFDGFADRIKPADMEKYRLWLEAGRISPYTGRVISLTDLFSPHIEIEHIVPYSRSLDNSMMNKTLCERSFNHDKNNRTPVEYFMGRSPLEHDRFIKRLGYFQNERKREQFLKEGAEANYLNSQLSDTAYIAKTVVEKLQAALPKVLTSKGRLTSLLRRQWGLNNLLYDDAALDHETIVTIKNRGDHRHHFIDACVLTAITPAIVQKVSRMELGNSGRLVGEEIEPPFEGFRHSIYRKVNQILVVHRMRKRLLNRSINAYRHSKSAGKEKRIGQAIRGSLHEDTLYGKITLSNGEERYVTRKDVRQLKEAQLEGIVDQGIKRHLKELIQSTPEGWTAVVKEPLSFLGRPLRRVRWMSSDTSMPMLREETRTFVAPGNNLLMAIYEKPSGKRDYLTISFYEGLQRRRRSEHIFPASIGDAQLKFTLKPYDKFILCEHPDDVDWNDFEDLQRRLYYVIKFTGNSIYLGQAHIANIKANYDKKPIKIQCNSNTISALKVNLDILGRLQIN